MAGSAYIRNNCSMYENGFPIMVRLKRINMYALNKIVVYTEKGGLYISYDDEKYFLYIISSLR